jgi:hypothetical protein
VGCTWEMRSLSICLHMVKRWFCRCDGVISFFFLGTLLFEIFFDYMSLCPQGMIYIHRRLKRLPPPPILIDLLVSSGFLMLIIFAYCCSILYCYHYLSLFISDGGKNSCLKLCHWGVGVGTYHISAVRGIPFSN